MPSLTGEDEHLPNCPACGSDLRRKHGFVLKKGGKKDQRYQCLICHKNYTEKSRPPKHTNGVPA